MWSSGRLAIPEPGRTRTWCSSTSSSCKPCSAVVCSTAKTSVLATGSPATIGPADLNLWLKPRPPGCRLEGAVASAREIVAASTTAPPGSTRAPPGRTRAAQWCRYDNGLPGRRRPLGGAGTTTARLVEAGRSVVEAREGRTLGPKQVDVRYATGVFGDLTLAPQTPADRVPRHQPGDLDWAVPGVRPKAAWLSGPVYRSVRRRPRRGRGFLGREGELPCDSPIIVASYGLPAD